MTVENLEIKVKTDAGNAATEMRSLANAVASVQTTARGVSGSASSTGKSLRSIGEAAKKTNSYLGNFLSSLKRIAFYRFIRSIIKSITQAFSEGLQNAYAFSQGITTEGHRFAQALDSMSTAGQTMKNQLGSAFLSLLSTIAPVVNAIVNLVVQLADAMSQFFSAFTGGTYLKAVNFPKAWANNAAKAGKAAKEWKNQLMSFDEINRLEDPANGGGGGGGAATADPSQMFVDTAIDPRIKAFVNRIKELIAEVKDRLEPALVRVKEAWDRFATAMGKFAQNFDGSWLDFMITDLLTLGGDLVLGGLTLLIDTLTVLVELFNALETGDWSGFHDALGNLFKDVTEWIDQLKKDLLLVIIDALIPVAEAFDKAFGTDITKHLEQTRDKILGLGSPLDMTNQELQKVQDTVRETGIVTTVTTAEVTLSAQEATSSVSAVGGAFTDVQYILKNFKMPSFHITGWENTDLVLGPGGTYPISLPNLGFFANGGFPESGQLFFANENGSAEMVGSMGGRTAVANNDQIVAGIEAGVFRAMTSAMNGQNGEREIRVYLDGKEIGAASRRYERSVNRVTGVAMA